MPNEKGREKKIMKDWSMTSFYIPDSFRDIWNQLNKISKEDNNQDFKNYCIKIEGVELSAKGQGLRGLYIRWILTKHVTDKLLKK